ncbi:hypothetical protein BJF90_35980 [Pseudonocardia sp. CNS-004]|nr:hypothetical protein BJF90_35980 [Pseudonocardia sp. CNS-004]
MGGDRDAGAGVEDVRSPIVMVPSDGSSRPAMQRIVLVLPHPDCPSRTIDSPAATSRSSRWTAVTPP